MMFNFAMGTIYTVFNCGNVYEDAKKQRFELNQMAEISKKIIEIDKK